MSTLLHVHEIAERQHGLVAADQALAAGLTPGRLAHAVARGDLDRASPRVLRVQGAPRTDHQAVLLAVLDAAPGAVAAGPTAASLWGIAGYRPAPVHVVRPRGTSRRSRLAVLHEVRRLLPHHVTVLDGVPVLRPERVVLDLCATEHPGRAARALDDAWRRRLLSGRSLRALVEEVASRGRPGLTVLRALLDERGDDYVPPASNLEHRFATVLSDAGVPAMRRQVDCGGDTWVGRVDFRDERLPMVVEVQSERYHSALTDRVADAARLAALRAAGFVVVEVTDEEVWHRPHEVVRRVGAARYELAGRDVRRRDVA